ncbi:acyl CoA binding protein-domain-containing protein [Paraphysoderma sedebokerense]|nr:acyl CoA binding protein-domain-containing protein [Paraphysoderma sedebokerense]
MEEENTTLDIESKFNKAVDAISNLPPNDMLPSTEEKLEFYALYKQATVGDVIGSRPSFWDLLARAKWDAWYKWKGTDEDEAKEIYVKKLVQFLKRFPDRPQALSLVRQFSSSPNATSISSSPTAAPIRTSTPEPDYLESNNNSIDYMSQSIGSYPSSPIREPEYESQRDFERERDRGDVREYDARSIASSSGYTITPAIVQPGSHYQNQSRTSTFSYRHPYQAQAQKQFNALEVSPIRKLSNLDIENGDVEIVPANDEPDNGAKTLLGAKDNGTESKLDQAQKALQIMQAKVAGLQEELERVVKQGHSNVGVNGRGNGVTRRKWSVGWLIMWIIKVCSMTLYFLLQ